VVQLSAALSPDLVVSFVLQLSKSYVFPVTACTMPLPPDWILIPAMLSGPFGSGSPFILEPFSGLIKPSGMI